METIKKGFCWTEKDVRKVLDEIGGKMGISCKDVTIIMSNRMKKNYGQFSFKLKKGQWVIPLKFTFNNSVFGGGIYPYEVLKETIIHEYVHFYCAMKYKENHGHNYIFQKHCVEAGISPERLFTQHKEAVAEIEYKYDIICPCCDKVINHKHRMNDISYYEKTHVCRKCRTHVVVKKNY